MILAHRIIAQSTKIFAVIEKNDIDKMGRLLASGEATKDYDQYGDSLLLVSPDDVSLGCI